MRICSGKSAATFCVETPMDPVQPSKTMFFGFIAEWRIVGHAPRLPKQKRMVGGGALAPQERLEN
jgi:hypothetical protein